MFISCNGRDMSKCQFLHDNDNADAKAIAIPWVSYENTRAKKVDFWTRFYMPLLSTSILSLGTDFSSPHIKEYTFVISECVGSGYFLTQVGGHIEFAHSAVRAQLYDCVWVVKRQPGYTGIYLKITSLNMRSKF